jgi:hypothetical protein
LKLLEKQGKIWSLLGEHIESSNQLLRNTSLHSLAVILEQRKTDEEVAESIFKQVSAAVHPNLLHKLTYFLSTPFPELRNVVFELERNIVLHTWGARLFLTTPGYVGWLLNRDTEKSSGEKTGAEWKYEIVKALTLSNPNAEPTVRSLIGNEAFEALVAYLKQGVFFQKTTAGTAIADKTK